jgi:hypothetical protein
MLYLDELASEYFHIFEAYRTRGDALTLLTNSRHLSHEAARQEDSDYRAEQMATAGYLIQKQEELSVENLYHTIRASRSAQTSTNSSQTMNSNKNGLLESSMLLNAVNSSEILNLLPLLQKNMQANANLIHSPDSYNMTAESSSGLTGLRSTCFNENVLSGSALE